MLDIAPHARSMAADTPTQMPTQMSALKAPPALHYQSAQHTLRGRVTCHGKGVHSGQRTSLTLQPAPPHTGYVFVRTDKPGPHRIIPARYDHVVETRLCTVLGNAHGVQIGTVEHLLSALRALGIDNAIIEVDNAEVPIMDGSAAPFMFLIDSAGTQPQHAPRSMLEVLRPVRVGNDQAWVELTPSEASDYTVTIDFASPAIGRQSFSARLSPAIFRTQIGRARTFGFMEDAEKLRQSGLALGASLSNTLVIENDTILNPEGLRLPHEFARHKLLDAIGDLALAGVSVRGHYSSLRGSHQLNNMLLRAVFADAANYRITGAQATPSDASPSDASDEHPPADYSAPYPVHHSVHHPLHSEISGMSQADDHRAQHGHGPGPRHSMGDGLAVA